MDTIRKMYNIPVGFSDHTTDLLSSKVAISRGANVIERHFTLNKNAEGPDHASSIEPKELKHLVEGSNAIFEANGDEKKIFEEERQILAWARESVVSEKDIKVGDKFSLDNVWVKRPSPKSGCIPAKDLKKIIGKIAKNNIKKDTQIKWEDIQ